MRRTFGVEGSVVSAWSYVAVLLGDYVKGSYDTCRMLAAWLFRCVASRGVS